MTVPQRAHVRLTQPAMDDLHRLCRRNPEALKWALSRTLLLEREPMAGQPLGGELHGFRKLTVGNRAWRIVWRVVQQGDVTVLDIVEVWAVGARANDEVYDEMRRRIKSAPRSDATTALLEAVERLSNESAPIASDSIAEVLPEWLIERLTTQARLPIESVVEMSLQEAVDAWTTWVSRSR